MPPPQPSSPPLSPQSLARLGTIYGVVIAVAGALILVFGCFFGVALFSRGLAASPPTPADSAAGFVLLGLALALRRRRLPSLLLSLLVVILGAIALTEHALDVHLGIDALFVSSGRVSGPQALCFVLEGGAVLLLGTRGARYAPYVALAAGAVGLVRAIAFLYGADSDAGWSGVIRDMSLPAAVLGILFSQGLGVAAPNAGLMALVSVDSPTGRLTQRLLLGVTSAPIALGFVRLKGEELGLYDGRFGLALFASANVIVMAALTWWVAAALVRAELAQRERERWLSTTLTSIGDAVIATDDSSDARVVRLNPVATALTGFSEDEARGKPLAEVFRIINQDTRTAVESPAAKVLREGTIVGLANHTLLVAKDGTERPIADSGAPIRDEDGTVRGVVLVFRDQTAEEAHRAAMGALEEQLRQSQKMEAIGQLAGGVAHDFNNLLSVVLSYAELIMQGLPEGDAVRADVGEIKQAGERASLLTRQLLAFSRKQILKPQRVELNDVIARSLGMLGRLLPESIALTFTPCEGGSAVRVDPVQFEQVLMNLVVNARDAMEKGGTLTVGTEIGELAAGDVIDLAAGSYVVLRVADDGVGMAHETAARIFEPFFTTKPKDKGTGLGLAVAFGIARQSGGTITVETAPGAGTTFRVFLPRATAAAAAPTGAAAASLTAAADEAGAAPARPATLLLVEDDPQVRELTARVLREAGYTVVTAVDGVAGLAAARAHAGTIDLLLTDVVMPRMGGRELEEKLRVMRPGLKVLFMSGFTDDAVVKHGVSEDAVAFLPKPIAPAALLQKVRAVLRG